MAMLNLVVARSLVTCARLGIMQALPSLAETVGDHDYACVVLVLDSLLSGMFRHALQKPMVLADFFNEAVGQGLDIPRAHKMASCGLGIS